MSDQAFASGKPWPALSEPPPLGAGDLQIWKVDIAPARAGIAELRARLSADERERADRYAFDRHRMRYTRARAALRALVGRHLGVPPADVRFGVAPGGKPFLAGNPASLYFNVSHSGDVALIALATGGEVGVDLERVRPRADDWVALARRYFCAEEVASLERDAPSERVDAFFRVWTRKEAIVKLLGDGLRMPLDRFIVPSDPRASAPVRLNDGSVVPWHLTPLIPAPAYWGACATYRRPDRIVLVEWVGDLRPFQVAP